MKSVTIYLRAPLFVPANGGTLPKQAMVLEGELVESPLSGGLTVAVKAWRDQDGRTLKGEAATLFLPMAKIDHVVEAS